MKQILVIAVAMLALCGCAPLRAAEPGLPTGCLMPVTNLLPSNLDPKLAIADDAVPQSFAEVVKRPLRRKRNFRVAGRCSC